MNFEGSHWGSQWGATPEAIEATDALIGQGSEIAAQQAERGGNQGLAATLREWAPVVGSYVKQFQDPNRQLLILEAKLQNARERGASRATIRLLEARVEAARRNAGLQDLSRQQTTSVKQSAVTTTRIFAGVGVALIILILSRALRR